MQFESLTEVLVMGGHGPYVWASYAMFALIMGANILAPQRRLKTMIARERRQTRRRSQADGVQQ